MSMAKWEQAASPNYETNVDKIYPYSEVPFIGQYKLVKIPLGPILIDLVDYWGEGKITSDAKVSGFADCYNVNHPFQCVSNGPDKGRKIPNRIPVRSYTHCDTSSYIKSDCVKTVTVMSAPINNSCAADIARMVNSEHGSVVVFGFADTSADVINLKNELKKRNLVRCDGFYLPESLSGLTLYDNVGNPQALKPTLYGYIMDSEYDQAVRLSKDLASGSYGNIIGDVVVSLLNEKKRNVMSFAYKLWNEGAQRILTKHFPVLFKSIFHEDYVKIISNNKGQALKLDANMDSMKDRMAWGDSRDVSSVRVNWRFMPVWKDNNVCFKIMNKEFGMFLELAAYTDSYNDREAWGSFRCNEARHFWYLDPVMRNGELLFFIVNMHYGQGLKLAVKQDFYGDRQLWGHYSDVHGDVDYFGWIITP